MPSPPPEWRSAWRLRRRKRGGRRVFRRRRRRRRVAPAARALDVLRGERSFVRDEEARVGDRRTRGQVERVFRGVRLPGRAERVVRRVTRA